jgi:hypothetical protein
MGKCEFEEDKSCEGGRTHCNDDKLIISGIVRRSCDCCSRRWALQEKLNKDLKDKNTNEN